MITAATAPESASTEPTERSMSPLAMTKVRPTASSAISEKASRIAKLIVEPAPEIRPRPQAEQPQRDHQDHRRRVAAIEEGGEPALAEAARLHRRAARLHARDRDAAEIGDRAAAARRAARPRARASTRRRTSQGSISTARMSTTPSKAGTAPGGNCATAATSHLLAADVDRCG